MMRENDCRILLQAREPLYATLMHPATSLTTRRKREPTAMASVSARASREELLTAGDGKRLISLQVAAGNKYDDDDSDSDAERRRPARPPPRPRRKSRRRTSASPTSSDEETSASPSLPRVKSVEALEFQLRSARQEAARMGKCRPAPPPPPPKTTSNNQETKFM